MPPWCSPFACRDSYTSGGYESRGVRKSVAAGCRRVSTCLRYRVGVPCGSVNGATKKACAVRLGRIEGQVRGIARMLGDDRYCIDVITQIQAVKAALRRVEEEMLRDHVSHC